MSKIKSQFLIILLLVSTMSVSAFEAANPYWLAIKPKLNEYLKKNIDKSKYTYTIAGPSHNLSNFIGNRPGLEIRFSNLNLNSGSMRKTVVATAYGTDGKQAGRLPIFIDVKIYKKVLTLRRSVQKGDEILPNNIIEKVIAINPRDARSYFNDRLAQKVAGTNMAAGAAIKTSQVRHEKLVQVGNTIKVSNNSPAIVLEFICKAMKSGDLGDLITVHCPDLQHKTKKAKLIDEAHAVLI